MRTFWITVGLGALVAVIGGYMATMGNNYNLGILLVAGGIIVAIIGLIMRLVMAYMGDKAA